MDFHDIEIGQSNNNNHIRTSTLNLLNSNNNNSNNSLNFENSSSISDSGLTSISTSTNNLPISNIVVLNGITSGKSENDAIDMKSFSQDEGVKEFDIEKENGANEVSKNHPKTPREKVRSLFQLNEEWKGKKTIKLMLERYIYGLIVAFVVSFFIVLLSLPNWSVANPKSTEYQSKEYLNSTVFSIFFIISLLGFGTIYITLSFSVSYTFKRVRESNILYYSLGISVIFIIFYMILSLKGIDYWYYYLDVLGVVIIFLIAEVLFAFKMSSKLQKEESSFSVVNTYKAIMVAYNYAAPDIVVTVFTVIYMFFLIPVYLSFSSPLFRLGWRLIIHPIYWISIVMIARQFLTRDISTDDIMLNSNIVLHTFFHHQTLGKIFVYTFSDDSNYTEIGIVISCVEEIIMRSLALKRDEWFFTILFGKEKALLHVYSQQSLQLRSAILNIQVALEFSGLISAPIFVFLFQKHSIIFHFFEGNNILAITLLYQSAISVCLDFVSEMFCTFIETRFYRMPIHSTWKWLKSHKPFMAWLVYGSVTMGLLGMIWTCARVPRAGLCTTNDICTCNTIIASSLPIWCGSNSTMIM